MMFSKLMRAALIAGIVSSVPMTSSAQAFVGIGITIAPPVIPIYVQPVAPAPNYIWEPGYWAWGPGGYYWVPGTWVLAPAIGLVWTPGYWGWNSGAYYWHPGYWGSTVGFYGGINYGFGYYGNGYVGGGWYGNVYRYNTAVTNVNRTIIHNTYIDRTVVVNDYDRDHVGYNGGHGGVHARATEGQIVAREHGQGPTEEQRYHEEMSGQDRNHLSTVNDGHPPTGAVEHPYSETHRPRHFAPVTNADRQEAQRHVAHPQGQEPPR